MKNEVVAVLIAVALIAGAGIAYFWIPFSPSETTTKTYTMTTTLNQGSNLVKCVIVYYEVDAAEFVMSSSTSYGSTTLSHEISNYTSVTSVEETVGYSTSTSVTLVMSGTSAHTGPVIASWDVTECTWVP
jgi:hypothetical protein